MKRARSRSMACLLLLWMTPIAIGSDKHALVIGVNDCPAFRLPGGQPSLPLQGAESDAKRMAAALERHFGFPGGGIVLLLGKDATKDGIVGALRELSRRAKPRDVVVIYFSGHGTQCADIEPFDESDDLDEALCPFDAKANGDGLLVDDELGKWIELIVSDRTTILLDCCHSGAGIKDTEDDAMAKYLPASTAVARRHDVATWRELNGATKSLDRRRTAFFACRSAERAYERRFFEAANPVRAGQFTFFFLDGFGSAKADGNRDGRITNLEMLEFARRHIDERFNETRRSPLEQQHPEMQSDAPDATLFESPDP